jgi:hypothetical protein
MHVDEFGDVMTPELKRDELNRDFTVVGLFENVIKL